MLSRRSIQDANHGASCAVTQFANGNQPPTEQKKMKLYPLRYCTGGCKDGAHNPHTYTVDPIDGELRNGAGFVVPHLCPGNAGPSVKECLDDETGERTGYGYIITE